MQRHYCPDGPEVLQQLNISPSQPPQTLVKVKGECESARKGKDKHKDKDKYKHKNRHKHIDNERQPLQPLRQMKHAGKHKNYY